MADRANTFPGTGGLFRPWTSISISRRGEDGS